MDVQFLKGLESDYQKMENKSSETFYSTEENLYLGDLKLTNNESVQMFVEGNTLNIITN